MLFPFLSFSLSPVLQGDCIITVLLTEDDKVESDDAAFFLVFTGSAAQHCTSTRKLDSGTLETLSPGKPL